MRQSAFAQDDCKTAADVWARARRVQALRKAMIPRPVPVVIAPPPTHSPLPPIKTEPPSEAPRTPLAIVGDPKADSIPMLAVIKAACQHFDLSASQLISPDRRQQIVFARHVCIYVAIEATQLSLNEISRRMGRGDRMATARHRGDHTTIMHARNKITDLLKAGDAKTVEATVAITTVLRRAYPNAPPPLDRSSRVYRPDASKPNQGKEYSDEDVAYIKRRWTVDGAKAVAIADELGRTKDAIARKLEHLGLCQAHAPLTMVVCANPQCGNSFQQRASRHVYCSSKCVDRDRKRRKREGAQ